MANFNTHLTASTVLSTITSICLYKADIISLDYGISFAFIGIVAGFIADIDSENTYARTLIYGLFGLIISIGCLLYLSINQYPILLNVLIFVIIYAVSRYGLSKIIIELTNRRGIFHSLPMAVAVTLLSVLIAQHFLKLNMTLCWWLGLYVLANYLMHLILDEIYAVDLANHSFRSRLLFSFKLFQIKPWWPYLILYILIGIMIYFLLPELSSLTSSVLTIDTLKSVWQHLF